MRESKYYIKRFIN